MSESNDIIAFTSNQLRIKGFLAAALVIAGMVLSSSAKATPDGDNLIAGVRLRVGWKYDEVRMCGATPRGVPHGPDIDISVFAEVAVFNDARIDINLPVFRPIMFWAGARMVQFEPEATLLFRVDNTGDTHFVIGPSMGVSIHYGPDLNSGFVKPDRGPSFFAMGPRIGGYAGFDFVRPESGFNFQLGLHPYVTPLISAEGPRKHRGWIAGMTLDNSFRFRANQ